jgi:hypothetical protein
VLPRAIALGNLDNTLVSDEDSSLLFNAANGNAITLSDVDHEGGEETLTLSVAHGVLTLATLDGLSVDAGANGTGSITVTGTLADLNAALDGLSYAPDEDYKARIRSRSRSTTTAIPDPVAT